MDTVSTVTNLKDLLVLIVYGGLGGVIAYQLCNWLFTKKPDWDFLINREVSILMSCIVSVVAWLIGIALEYFKMPAPTVKDWLEAIFVVVGPIYLGSQISHGIQKSRAIAKEKALMAAEVKE